MHDSFTGGNGCNQFAVYTEGDDNISTKKSFINAGPSDRRGDSIDLDSIFCTQAKIVAWGRVTLNSSDEISDYTLRGNNTLDISLEPDNGNVENVTVFGSQDTIVTVIAVQVKIRTLH